MFYLSAVIGRDFSNSSTLTEEKTPFTEIKDSTIHIQANNFKFDNTQDEVKKEELKQEIVAEEAKVNDELSSIAENLKNQHLAGSAELTEKLLTKQQDGQKNTKDRLARRKEANNKAQDKAQYQSAGERNEPVPTKQFKVKVAR